jgi:V/A-type H+/Na+-transporting ATPase subunit D
LAESRGCLLKLTKNGLRAEQSRLALLNKYLPTLQLKKAMLLSEVVSARHEWEICSKEYEAVKEKTDAFAPVLSDPISFSIQDAVRLQEVKKRYENIAGIDIPYLDVCVFEPFEYSLFDTPAWVDGAILNLRKVKEAEIRKEVAREKIEALEKELREVSIRVNLFEKVLIPRANGAIKKIGVFLADQLLAGVSRAKVAKSKIYGAS